MSKTYTYKLSSLSYALPLLHAAKHSSESTLGIYIGTISNSTVEIKRAIPLLHHYLSLSPLTETSISLIQEYAKTLDLVVVGFWICKNEPGLGRIGERLLDGLDGDGVFGLVVDDASINKSFPYTIHTKGSKSSISSNDGLPESWSVENDAVLGDGTLGLIREQEVHQSVLDFDDHVHDSEADWMENKVVVEAIKKRFG